MSRRARRASSRRPGAPSAPSAAIAGRAPNASSSSFSGSRSPIATNTRATSSDRALGGAGHRRDRRRVDEPEPQRVRRSPAPPARPPRRALGDLAAAPLQLLAAEPGRRRRSPRKPSRPASIVDARSPGAPSTRYQRVTASTSMSTPPISSAWISGSTLPSRSSIVSQSRLRADDLAGDPVGPHDLGRPDAALGDDLGDEHRPERVDHEVGVDRGEQLAPQRMLRQQRRRSARPPAAGSSRAGRAASHGSSSSEDSSSDSFTRRFAYVSSSDSSGRSIPRPARRRSASSSPDGSASERAVEQPVLLEPDHQVLVGVEPRGASAASPGR